MSNTATDSRSTCVCRPGAMCNLECIREWRVDYLLAELRCAVLRARLWQADIEAVGMALKAGLIHPEQALELLAECDCLQLISPPVPAQERLGKEKE